MYFFHKTVRSLGLCATEAVIKHNVNKNEMVQLYSFSFFSNRNKIKAEKRV